MRGGGRGRTASCGGDAALAQPQPAQLRASPAPPRRLRSAVSPEPHRGASPAPAAPGSGGAGMRSGGKGGGASAATPKSSGGGGAALRRRPLVARTDESSESIDSRRPRARPPSACGAHSPRAAPRQLPAAGAASKSRGVMGVVEEPIVVASVSAGLNASFGVGFDERRRCGGADAASAGSAPGPDGSDEACPCCDMENAASDSRAKNLRPAAHAAHATHANIPGEIRPRPRTFLLGARRAQQRAGLRALRAAPAPARPPSAAGSG